jgi:hypothetical protein
MAVGEHDITVGVDEVGRPEPSELCRERDDLVQAILQAGLAAISQRTQAVEEGTERMFRVGIADRSIPADAKSPVALDARKHAVVGEQVEPASELVVEWLRVAQQRSAPGRAADVRDDDRAGRIPGLEKRELPAAVRSIGFADDERVAVLEVRDASAIAVRTGASAVTRKLVHREVKIRRISCRHRQQLAHDHLADICLRASQVPPGRVRSPCGVGAAAADSAWLSPVVGTSVARSNRSVA